MRLLSSDCNFQITLHRHIEDMWRSERQLLVVYIIKHMKCQSHSPNFEMKFSHTSADDSEESNM